MKRALAWFLSVVFLSSWASYGGVMASVAPVPDGEDAVEEAVGPAGQLPGGPEDQPEPPPRDPPRERAPRAREQQAPPGEAGQRGASPRGLPPGRPPREPEMRPQRRPPLPQVMDWLLPAIAERRPELAERLQQMRKHAPERFHRLLVDALIMRLEEAAQREEHRPFRSGARLAHDRPSEHREWDEAERELRGPHAVIEREMKELHQRNEELEHRSAELAQRYRELREQGRPELEAEFDEVRHHIAETVEQHFEVRTELRRMEFRRVEMELDRMREVLERIRHDLERREHARGAIIKRRIGQLLGEDPESW